MNTHNYSEYQHTSVKVHHEPGGGSQWSIGGWDNQSAQASPQKRQQPPQQQQPQYQQQYQAPQQQQSHHQQQPQASYPPQQQPGYGGSIHHGGDQGYSNSQSTRNMSPTGPVGVGGGHRMRSEFNIGSDGNDRTSVKVHHAPGGKSNLNIFGGGGGWDEQPSAHQSRKSPGQQLSPKIGAGYHVGQQYAVNSRQQPGNISGAQNRGPSPTQHQQSRWEPAQQQQPANYPPPKMASGQWQQSVGRQSPQQHYPPAKQPSYPNGLSQGMGGQQHQVPEYEQHRQYSPPQRHYQQAPQQHQQVQQQYPPPKQSYGGQQSSLSQSGSQVQVTFGHRVESGVNSGPTTEKSSIKLHNPPGGRSQIQLF